MLTTVLITLLSVLPVALGANWQMVWRDDFNGPTGSAPDGSKWRHETGATGWGNKELQDYTAQTRNAQLDGNGNLLITARRDGAGKYTSARLITKGKFETTYGRIEARIKLPWGKGVWPAFWMLGNCREGWPNCGEIDIMEMQGSDPTRVSGAIHGPGYSGGGSYSNPNGRRFSDDFHVYAVEWYPNSVIWYVDGKAYQTRTPANFNGKKWVFNSHPFYILLNFAVGGNFDGNPDGSTPFPQSMIVDFVHVYRQV